MCCRDHEHRLRQDIGESRCEAIDLLQPHALSARDPQDLDRCRRGTEAVVDVHCHDTWGTAP